MKEDILSRFISAMVIILYTMLIITMFKCMALESEKKELYNLVQQQGDKIVQLEKKCLEGSN